MRRGQLRDNQAEVVRGWMDREVAAYTEWLKKWDEQKFEDFYYATMRLIERHRQQQYESTRLLHEILDYEMAAKILAYHRLDMREDAREEANLLWLEHREHLHNEIIRILFFIFLQAPEYRVRAERILELYPELAGELSSFLAPDADDEKLQEAINGLRPLDPSKNAAWAQLPQQAVSFTFRRRYAGHINEQTVKDITFVGLSDEYVASGSDGGAFFIWPVYQETTPAPLFIGVSDHHVVNCIAQHPRLPLLAVSGIDNDIKLWEAIGGSGEWKSPVGLEEWEAIPKDKHEEFIRTLQQRRRATTGGTPMATITIPCPVQ
jgi:hypothetical protein